MKYLVAEEGGGIMECPDIYYSNFQVIEATSGEEARKIYNKKNNCSYYYGVDLCEYTENLKFLIELNSHIPKKMYDYLINFAKEGKKITLRIEDD